MLSRDPLANPEPLIRRVYRYVAYRVGDGPEAEDVTSETFERALRYRSSYDARKGEPLPWLIGIARRCIDDALAKRPWLTEALPEREAPEDLEEQTMLRLQLTRALAGLSEHDRELLALRYAADLSTRQIAELTDAKTSAVDVALHRARERLRQRLEADEPAPPPAPVPENVRI